MLESVLLVLALLASPVIIGVICFYALKFGRYGWLKAEAKFREDQLHKKREKSNGAAR